MSMICVPIMVEESPSALLDASLAQAKGADLVEFRVDLLFEQHDEEPLEERMSRVLDLVKESPLPCIVTCRPHWEGGDYHGDDDERISLYEALGTSDHPPAYIDVELATYTRSANIRQKVNLAVDHPKQQRTVTTKLILSTHDFSGRPSDLTRKILTMNDEPACAVVKIAYRARSIRDNLELFEILRDRQKPTIALGMGEFGGMSRILAPKFGGLLTFASLRSESTTAPGQPTIDELLNLYRFRSIKPTTKVYGIIGYPVTQSMSPLVHNAGFEEIRWDGVYVPMPVEGSYESFKATVFSLSQDSILDFCGASVTLPHKLHLARTCEVNGLFENPVGDEISANTIVFSFDFDSDTNNFTRSSHSFSAVDTDYQAIRERIWDSRILIMGTGGVARAVLKAVPSGKISIVSREISKAEELAAEFNNQKLDQSEGRATAHTIESLPTGLIDIFINCTPVGMKDGPNPDGMSIPLDQFGPLAPETVIFDTVYNPIETPLLKYAKNHGLTIIDGASMFVRQAEMQFGLFIGDEDIFVEGIGALFDDLVRTKLSQAAETNQ